MFTNFVNKPVGRKTQNMLSLQMIQVAIEGMVAIRVKGTVHRFRVKDKEGIKNPKSSLKMFIP
jgi:hypothetical protein